MIDSHFINQIPNGQNTNHDILSSQNHQSSEICIHKLQPYKHSEAHLKVLKSLKNHFLQVYQENADCSSLTWYLTFLHPLF